MTTLLLTFSHVTTWLPALMISHFGLVNLVLWLLVFIETGVVIMPFLPGDSILFLTGSLAVTIPHETPLLLILLLSSAAILGDWVNFEIGHRFGNYVVNKQRWQRLIKPKYLKRTQHFFNRHGNLAIFWGRFVPIVRTMVPFTAGMGQMRYQDFLKFNALGGFTWVSVVIGTGYLLGSIPFVKANFEIILVGIVGISLIPMGLTTLRTYFRHQV
ncbi:DedA family protein [Furfurilactobacillus curtus]|uniref:Cytochrome o ubiquinol oxidase n=1 Tax=Furfurilactobacillus curtus TaxID=1746200 RepID=A0ABQ5JQ82_9LACO